MQILADLMLSITHAFSCNLTLEAVGSGIPLAHIYWPVYLIQDLTGETDNTTYFVRTWRPRKADHFACIWGSA